jgi:predicted RecA/RadA family phage recombinase
MAFARRLYTHEDTDRTFVVGTTAVVGGLAVEMEAANGIKPKVVNGGDAVKTFGVAEYDAAVGEDVNVIGSGSVIRNAVAGAAITAGARVKANAEGQFVPALNDATDEEMVAGRAWTASTADGDEFILELF